MGCIKLSILDQQYKRIELKVSYNKNELTYNNNVKNAGRHTLFGEIISNYNPMSWQNGIVPEYMFSAKELDEENGMYYYEARYLPPGRPFISRDPHFERYFWLSPYSYAANNPIKYFDPTGKDVEITGTEQKTAFKELKTGAAQYGVKVKMDKTGQISGRYTGKGEMSNEAKELLSAINSDKIKVNINATDGNKTEGNVIFFGGAFLGSEVSADGRTVNVKQDVNPADLKVMDDYNGKKGQGMLHEVMEAYTGGKLALATGKSIGNSLRDRSTYEIVHDMTGLFPQSGEVTGIKIESNFPNIYGGRDQVGRRFQISAPGKPTWKKDVYQNHRR